MLVIPKARQAEIIRNAHERHFSTKKTMEIVRQDFYIPKIESKMQKCIANCIPCILTNRKRGKQEGQLHPLHKEGLPLHTYHINHLGPLDSTNKNYKHILAIVDSFYMEIFVN